MSSVLVIRKESDQVALEERKAKRTEQVFEFKVQLRGVKPPIWRRIQVPESYSFWDLHCAIQDAMGWMDSHLHQFEVLGPDRRRKELIGIPDPDGWRSVRAGWSTKVRRFMRKAGDSAEYLYDFGDGWEHTVRLQKVLPRDPDATYPRCVAGRRACPPEDCGGIWGYQDIVAGESECQEKYEDFDPESFHPSDVIFDDPKVRLEWRERWM